MSQHEVDPAVAEYIAEGQEIIERVSKGLRVVEDRTLVGGGTNRPTQDSPKDVSEVLSSIYRDVHTLKGSSQLFGFKLIAQISHAMEASLDPVRKGTMKLTSMMTDACARNIDLVDKLLASIKNTGAESHLENDVVKMVGRMAEATTQARGAAFSLMRDNGVIESTISVPSSEKPMSAPPAGIPAQSVSQSAAPMPAAAVSATTQSPASQPPAAPAAPAAGAPGAHAHAPVQADATIRVHVSLLDRILNLMGELVLVRNQILQYRHRIQDSDFLASSKSLDVVTTDLQGEVMKTRMQPIETVVGKFQRVVRDIARDLGKRIDLTLEGSETELDKSLLEAIKDPLTHIIRNSCDHGIETPEERHKANKPETGHLLIRSFHEGGQVVIEVSDDGRGIGRKRVVEKAIEKGILSAEDAADLSDREICEIIFRPGFSTASQVTSVSGRGVGMDVVKTNIEKIGGSVEVKSVEGKGTTMQLRIPLTLAIVPALIVKSGKSKFAIPQVKLVELVRVDGSSAGGGPKEQGARIEKLQGRPMFRLRGLLLPLYDLRDITGEKYDPDYQDGVFIIVLSTESEMYGLLVPEVMDTADIVVKPMGPLLKHLSAFSGATILGDGSIALILDAGGVAERGHVLNKRSQKDDREAFSKQEKSLTSADIQEFLLFSIGTSATHSVPVALVNRLEEFPASMIEKSGDQFVVRYRGGLLPLLRVKNMLGYTKTGDGAEGKQVQAQSGDSSQEERWPVIVIQRSGRSYGFVVDEILDVLATDCAIDDSLRDRSGILGNFVSKTATKEEIVVVLDALGVIEDFSAAMSGRSRDEAVALKHRDGVSEIRSISKNMKLKSVRVLYAEDVVFFRRHVSKVLASAGIDVTTVEDGAKALQELESADEGRYNLVISDIEMPNMNGIALARAIRKHERLKHLPLIALTTRFRDKDVREGKEAGFNEYLEKLNPDKLLEAVNELMGAQTSAVREEGLKV